MAPWRSGPARDRVEGTPEGGKEAAQGRKPDDDSEAGREAGGAGSTRGRSSLPRSAVLLPELRGRGQHKEGRGGDDQIPEPEIRSPHRSRLDAATPPRRWKSRP